MRLLAVMLALSGCGSADDEAPVGPPPLTCKDGDYYLDGQLYTSCDQCSEAPCTFKGIGCIELCENGVCNTTCSSETAVCGDQEVTIHYEGNDVWSCE